MSKEKKQIEKQEEINYTFFPHKLNEALHFFWLKMGISNLPSQKSGVDGIEEPDSPFWADTRILTEWNEELIGRVGGKT